MLIIPAHICWPFTRIYIWKPKDPSYGSQKDYKRDKNGWNFIGNSLYWGLSILSIFNKSEQLIVSGILDQLINSHNNRTLNYISSSKNLGAQIFWNWERLSSKHRFITWASAEHHCAICWNSTSWLNKYVVIQLQKLYFNFLWSWIQGNFIFVFFRY